MVTKCNFEDISCKFVVVGLCVDGNCIQNCIFILCTHYLVFLRAYHIDSRAGIVQSV